MNPNDDLVAIARRRAENWRNKMCFEDEAYEALVAAEIGQLRSDLELRNQTALDRKEIIERLESAASWYTGGIAERDAAIERLRAALKQIADLIDDTDATVFDAIRIARQAIGYYDAGNEFAQRADDKR